MTADMSQERFGVLLSPLTILWREVTRLLYGEDNDVWHDARDDSNQQEEETFHDVRDQVEEIQVIKAINGNVTNLEIPGYDRIDPSVFLNDTQDEIRRSVSGIPRMKKVNIILVCMYDGKRRSEFEDRRANV
jgi:hypothetical protein